MPALSLAFSAPLVERASAFWRWWIGELRPLVPNALLRGRRPVPRADILALRDSILVDREVGNVGERFGEPRPLAELDEAGWADFAELVAGLRARLILSAPDVFVTCLTLPAAARGRLRSAVALQLRQLAPVDPEVLVWNCRITGQAPGGIVVFVAMARRSTLDRLSGLFDAHGIPVPPIVARSGDTEIELAGGGDGSVTPERRRLRRAGAYGALLMATVPLTTWLLASLLTWSEEGRARELHRMLAPRLAEARAQAHDEQARRALRLVMALPSASTLVEGVALGLPDSAFALDAERSFDGHFSVEAQGTDRAALERSVADSPLLSRLRPSSIGPVEGPSVQVSLSGYPR